MTSLTYLFSKYLLSTNSSPGIEINFGSKFGRSNTYFSGGYQFEGIYCLLGYPSKRELWFTFSRRQQDVRQLKEQF